MINIVLKSLLNKIFKKNKFNKYKNIIRHKNIFKNIKKQKLKKKG